MITLIKNANVYSPVALGINDILIANNKILAIEPTITLTSAHVRTIDAKKMIAMPGMVDSLVHISGGGGEGGFHTRTPEMPLSDATLAGVTTVIGALGTDSTTRSLADLLAKVRALKHEGISAFCYTGSYHYPVKTLTGSVTDDIILINDMIGIGELAIADHRASHLSVAELARVASEARVGGMLSGKRGIVSIHTGDADSHLSMLHKVIEQSDVPATQFYPTHINRNQSLLEAGLNWTRQGGFVDMTASTNAHFIAEGEIPAAEAVAWLLKQGVNVSQVTMSSDGNASLPVFDKAGRLVGLEVGKVSSLRDAFCALAAIPSVPLADAISCVTASPASILGLTQKGQLSPGFDADIALCEPDSLVLLDVFANGVHMVKQGKAIQRGTFEAAQ